MAASTCPLCRSPDATEVTSVAFRDIFDALERQWGASFPREVTVRHMPTLTTSLVVCADCELAYFTPAVAGDADFYDRLTAATGYESSRWEFARVADRIAPGAAVADFGAGAGDFLACVGDRVGDRVGRLVGIDLNPRAVDQLRRRGFEAHQTDMAAFADAHAGDFDVATGFHLIEHIPDVAGFVGPATRALRHGGRLFISAPNALRADREAFEPKDHPPHHLSRWRPTHWQVLADRFGLTLRTVDTQPPPIIVYEQHLAARIARLADWLVRPVLSVLWHTGLTRRRHRRLVARGWFAERGLFGHTMLAEFVKDRG